MPGKKITKIQKPKKYKLTFEAFIMVYPEEVDNMRTTSDDVAWDKAEEFATDANEALESFATRCGWTDKFELSLLDVKPTRR